MKNNGINKNNDNNSYYHYNDNNNNYNCNSNHNDNNGYYFEGNTQHMKVIFIFQLLLVLFSAAFPLCHPGLLLRL